MLNDKQIANMRKIVRYTWVPWLMLFMMVIYLAGAGLKLVVVNRLCSQTELTWPKALSLTFSTPLPEDIYSGVEVIATGQIEGAILYFGSAIIFVIFFFGARRMRERDKLLLQYIDKENEMKAQQGVAPYVAQSAPSGER